MTAMINVATENLEGLALDWAVGIADGRNLELPSGARGRTKVVWLDPFVVKLEGRPDFHDKTYRHWAPSTDWAQCGPLLDKYQVALIPEAHDGLEGTETSERWYADVYFNAGEQYTTTHCDTALIAACRAIVATVFGDTVQVPAELVAA